MPKIAKAKAVREVREELSLALIEAEGLYALYIEAGQHANIDHDGFTSHTQLERFRKILNQPGLMQDELESLLRTARVQLTNRVSRVPAPYNRPVNDEDHWSVLMAGIVLHKANENVA